MYMRKELSLYVSYCKKIYTPPTIKLWNEIHEEILNLINVSEFKKGFEKN